MSLVSDMHSPGNVSASPVFSVVRGESESDAVTQPHSIATAISSPEPAVLPPNRREHAQESVPLFTGGNTSDVPAAERVNKPAWGRPYNGAIDTPPVVLGGSSSWPALSESAKASAKPSSDGSASSLLKFSNRGGGNSGNDVGTSGSFSSNGEPSSSPSTSSSAEISQNITGKQPYKGNYNNWNHHPRESHGWVDQGDRRRRQGGSNRRGWYGSKRDDDRGCRDWNSYKFLGVREPQMQRSHPGFPLMSPHMPAMMPFFGPPLFQHFPCHMAYPDFQPQLFFFPTYPHSEPFGGFPVVPHPAPPATQQPIFFTSAEQKRILILNQIEYYFSSENLCSDLFLRSNMDNHGPSDILEVEGNRVRKRDGWKIWIFNPRKNQYNTESEPISQSITNQDSLISQLESIALNESNTQAT